MLLPSGEPVARTEMLHDVIVIVLPLFDHFPGMAKTLHPNILESLCGKVVPLLLNQLGW